MTPSPTPTPMPADAPVDNPWLPDGLAPPPLEVDVADDDVIETSELSYMSCSNGTYAENVDIVVTIELSVVVYGIVSVARSIAVLPEHCAVTIVDEEIESAHF